MNCCQLVNEDKLNGAKVKNETCFNYFKHNDIVQLCVFSLQVLISWERIACIVIFDDIGIKYWYEFACKL